MNLEQISKETLTPSPEGAQCDVGPRPRIDRWQNIDLLRISRAPEELFLARGRCGIEPPCHTGPLLGPGEGVSRDAHSKSMVGSAVFLSISSTSK